MKGIPLPADAPLIIQLLFWGLLIIVGLLFAGLIFFIKRYIDKNDSHHAGVEATLKTHSTTFTTLTDRISAEANKIDRAAAEMTKTQAAFQKEVNRELLEIHKMTGQIKTDLTTSNSQVGLLKKDLDGLVETVGKHQRSLSTGAQAMIKQRDELAQVRTEIVKIGEELILIRDKKPKS